MGKKVSISDLKGHVAIRCKTRKEARRIDGLIGKSSADFYFKKHNRKLCLIPDKHTFGPTTYGNYDFMKDKFKFVQSKDVMSPSDYKQLQYTLNSPYRDGDGY